MAMQNKTPGVVLRALSTIILLGFCLIAGASQEVFFDIAVDESTLTLTARGSHIAYRPSVLRLRGDGSWEHPGSASAAATAQLAPDSSMSIPWTPADKAENPASLRAIQPLMVCYFEQDGMHFCQLALLHPPENADLLGIERNGTSGLMLTRRNDSAAAATWILAAPKSGTASLATPLTAAAPPGPARRIDWRTDNPTLSVSLPNTGDVWLLHETPAGWRLQIAPELVPAKRLPTAFWLSHGNELATIGGLLLLLSAALGVRQKFRPT